MSIGRCLLGNIIRRSYVAVGDIQAWSPSSVAWFNARFMGSSSPIDRSPSGTNSLQPMRPGQNPPPTMSPYAAQSPSDRASKSAIAQIKYLPTSVKKMNVVAKFVRRLHLDDALVQLTYINEKKAARILLKALLSARLVARQGSPYRGPLATEHLVVDEITVLRGAYRPLPIWFRGMGRISRRYTASCHVYIRLREVPGAEMRTVILRPWWERRNHRRGQHRRRGMALTTALGIEDERAAMLAAA